jgi:antibiotic biosynthesis monooxygenase (ABM) superfamily enzyme
MAENKQDPVSMLFRRVVKSVRAGDFEGRLWELVVALQPFGGYLGLDGHLTVMRQLLDAY